jgi:hypothetical protein
MDSIAGGPSRRPDAGEAFAHPAERPIFVFAQPRSGSTLVQRLVNSLEDVILYGEHLEVLTGVAAAYDTFMARRGHSFCSEDSDRAAVQAKALHRLKDPTDFSPNANALSYEHVRATFRDFVKALVHPVRDPRFRRWGFKEIRYWSHDRVFEMLIDLFPQATFVFVVRHPLEQIASHEGTGWGKASIRERAERWRDQAVSYLEYHRRRPDLSRLVRYEDLTRADSDAGRALIEFLGYAYTARQDEILFGLGKVGAAEKRPEWTEATRDEIRRICLVPEVASLYRPDEARA